MQTPQVTKKDYFYFGLATLILIGWVMLEYSWIQ